MVDINEIMSFIQVVQAGGFQQAERRFGTPKSTLSRHIMCLEKRLHLTLLHRTTRKVSLTALGQQFYLRSLNVLKDLEDVESELQSTQKKISGLVRFTAPIDLGTTLLATPLAKFCKQYPEISIDLVLTDRVLDLIGENVDFAIRAGPLLDSNFKFKKLFMETMTLVASPDYLNRSGHPQSPKELENFQCLIFAPHAELMTWTLSSENKTAKVTPKSQYRVSSFTMCLELAKQGLGIALVPSFMHKNSILTGELELVLHKWKTEVRPISIVWPHQNEPPNRVKLLIDFLVTELTQTK